MSSLNYDQAIFVHDKYTDTIVLMLVSIPTAATSKNILTLDLRATGSSGSTLGFLGPSSSSSEEDSSSAEGIGDSAILYWNGRVVFKAV